MIIPAEYAEFFQKIAVGALPIIFAITLHEAAHGFVASWLGDDTALRICRVTLNPIRHIDLVGTIILPLILLLGSRGMFMFGYAKPVPVRFDRLNKPRRDMVYVALAGPLTNILLALISALLLYTTPHLPGFMQKWMVLSLLYSIDFNIIIALFNMIPLPPLDGGRVAVGILPDVLAIPLARTERYGMLVLLGLLFVLPVIGQAVHMDLNVIAYLLQTPFDWVRQLVFEIAGINA